MTSNPALFRPRTLARGARPARDDRRRKTALRRRLAGGDDECRAGHASRACESYANSGTVRHPRIGGRRHRDRRRDPAQRDCQRSPARRHRGGACRMPRHRSLEQRCATWAPSGARSPMPIRASIFLQHSQRSRRPLRSHRAQDGALFRSASFSSIGTRQSSRPAKSWSAVHIPRPKPGVGLYLKHARVAGDFAIVSVAVSLARDGEVHVAIGGCGP